MMTRRVITIILLLMVSMSEIHATHNRAGEITYVQLSDLTYRVTITTFTYTKSRADRPQLDAEWGDNTYTTIDRVSETILPNYYKKNVYIAEHTYPGPGIYKIVVQDPNRNFGVQNIPNSVNVVFSITTTLMVNSSFGLNSTPVLLNPPYDKAALGHIFVHNPAAYDPDGDSLSYRLTTCTKEDGKIITDYTLPPASHKFYVDSVSGDLVWDAPTKIGIYNVAMEIQEWRNGIKIGVVIRDMQIEVYETDNNPPVTSPLTDLCIEAGDTVRVEITSTDVDGDSLALIATSGIFTSGDSSSFLTTANSPGLTTAMLIWIPGHESVRHQPYDIIIKAEDYNEELQLVDIDNMSIKVLGPSPDLITADPEGNFVRLTWAPYESDIIAGFSIYRREGSSSLSIDDCVDGIPTSAEFVKVGYVSGYSALSFVDTQNGEGLETGVEYAYRIVAVYPNGTESKPSDEMVTSLITGIPLVTNVSVLNTDAVNGSVYLAWQVPDTIPVDGTHYQYQIYRANGIAGSDYQLIHTINTTDLSEKDYTDNNLNTQETGYIYKIGLYNNESGTPYLIGEPGIASSLFIIASPGDRKARFVFTRNVPWINTRYDIFRYNDLSSSWDSVGSTNMLSWTDTGLLNGTEYCYYVRSTGGYQGPGTPKNLVNLSQRTCVTPVDNEAPCPPVLTVSSDCEELENIVTWTIEDPVCYEDVAGYKLYYRETLEGSDSIITINDREVHEFIHEGTVTGCYAISALDSHGNEGDLSARICVDSCDFYEIPNVFTPNNDGVNDRLVARTSALVEKVDFRLFNRGGVLIFTTQEPRLNWDGTFKGKVVAPGVYYYDCEVFEKRISGVEQFHLNGFVHVITEKGAEPKIIEEK